MVEDQAVAAVVVAAACFHEEVRVRAVVPVLTRGPHRLRRDNNRHITRRPNRAAEWDWVEAD